MITVDMTKAKEIHKDLVRKARPEQFNKLDIEFQKAQETSASTSAIVAKKQALRDAPAASAIEMAESYLKDKKRVLPCAALCEGEFDVNGYFIGVPTVIGSNGIEKILEFQLQDSEKAELQNTLDAVKKTVEETKL